MERRIKLENLSRSILEFYEKISSWEESVVKGSGLTTSQIHAIEIVGHARALKMKDLAEKIGVTTGTLTVAVDKLEKKGLLLRKPHENDRRSYMIELTQEGMTHFEEHHNFHLRMTQEIVSGLSEQEQEAFGTIMEKVLKTI